MLLARIRRTMLCSMLPMAWAGIAQAADDVNVNLLVFAQPEHSVSFEIWRPAAELKLSYPANLIDLQGSHAPRDERYIDQGLSNSQRLDRSAQRLQAADYRVLLQKSWRQPLPAQAEAPSILLRGGQSLGEHQELEGYLTLYYHENRIRLGTHLWLSRLGQDANTQATTAVLPDASSVDVSLKSTSPGLPVANVVTLNDTRIINEGELHYVDHPRFGLLIEVGGTTAHEQESAEPSRTTDATANPTDTNETM